MMARRAPPNSPTRAARSASSETHIEGDGASLQRRADGLSTAFSDNVILALFIAGIVGNTLLQKIAVPLGSAEFIPLVLPLFVGAIAIAGLFVTPHFDPIRVVTYFLLVIAASVSTFFLAPKYSALSLLLFCALYLPIIIEFSTSTANYQRCLKIYIAVMLGFVGVTVAQHVVQLAASFRSWPDLNVLVPERWLVPEYNYIQPIVYGSRYMKPNGVVFLEVSLLSQYIAIALAAELIFFRRIVPMIVLTAGLLMTLAGTGLLLMALTLPVLLARLRLRNAITVAAILAVVVVIAFYVGWFDIVSSRTTEYKESGSSANLRFILPAQRMVEFLNDPRGLIGGIGAGRIEKLNGFIWWPFTKATIEYGLLTGVLFYGVIIYSLFRRAPDRAFAFVLLVWYTFEGTLLTAHNALSLVLFGTLLRTKKDTPTRRRDRAVLFETTKSRPLSPRKSATPTVVLPEPAESHVTGEALVDLMGVPDSAGRLVYAIGDLHGRVDLFDRLIDAIRSDVSAQGHADGDRPMIVLLGDYIDRGPQSAQVLDRILMLERDPFFEVRSVLGNHEDAMLAFLDGRSSGASWIRHGGLATLTSYGVPAPADGSSEEMTKVRDALRSVLPSTHEDYLRRLEHYVLLGGLIFVHAGLRPGVALEKQRLKDILYIREEFLGTPTDADRLIVHGHTPRDEPYGARGRLCVDTGAYATGVLTAVRFDGGRPGFVAVR